MKLFSSWKYGAVGIHHFVARPDNVLSNSGKEFYQPDWIKGVEAKAVWLVRIGKVAKCIDQAYAGRYYDQLSVGISLRASKLEGGLPERMKEDFDCSLYRWSEWRAYDEIKAHPLTGVKMLAPDQLVERYPLVVPEQAMIESMIAEVSRYYLLKIGDLLAFPAMEGVWQMEREQGLFICNECEEELVYMRIK
ncbi:hypothetical protein [uncultured Porphyromonas sp.]|uniref:hypothetical protein n=1 Tax=uncultured Porphyromonas sp. TaxID=159274 RepID=UPI002630BC8D|nr:hypothetical protein [uncultured Porphyromonas sp.]